jgi:hypothetical protein
MSRSTFFLGAALAALLSPPALAQDAAPAPQYPTTQFADGATTATVTDKGVTATITMQRRPDIDPDIDVPVLTVSVNGKPVIESVGVDSGTDDPAAEASIVEMDAGNATPEVYFASFSGGAHCCTTVIIAEEVNGAWVTVPIGEFDGDGGYLGDLDADGEAEIGTADNRFLYQFDCYACSAAPLAIYGVKAGNVVDLSGETRFLPAHREWLKTSIEASLKPEDWWKSRGFLAGWVGEKVRIGEGVQAWHDLNAHWDLADDPGEEVCPDGSDSDSCDAKQRVTMKFPERLRAFLKANGYGF